MSSATVKAAVHQRLSANWTATAIRDGNADFDTAGLPWVQIRFPGAKIERDDIGDSDNPLWMETGAFMCDVWVPFGTGESYADDLADALADLFQGVEFDGISCESRLAGTSGEADNGLDGRWWGVHFGITYRFQSIG